MEGGMEKTASEIQKERIREIEGKAAALLAEADMVTLASVNEAGYPRACAVSKLRADGFRQLIFMTSKRSHLHGKATHFENNPKASVCCWRGGDSVTLIGSVEILRDAEEKQQYAQYCYPRFFKNGVQDPRCYILRFRTEEATFWIEGKFRTCRYKP